MKTIFALTMGLLFAAAGTNNALAREGETREQIVGVNDAYIPAGFDSSADAFVVVSGLFPNGCYKFSNATVEHPSVNLHVVTVKANLTEGLCLMVLVPFSQEIQLGKLAAGDHAIRFLASDGTYWEKQFTISE